MRRTTYPVCQLPQGRDLRKDPCNSIKWALLVAAEDSYLLFKVRKKRREELYTSLRVGFLVMFRYRCGAWIVYGWMSRSSRGWLPHLPTSIQVLNAYWMFYSRRRDGFRGLRYYKRALRLLAQRASKEQQHASTCVDTRAGIVASGRSILPVVVRPKGVITTCRLQVPKVSSYVWWWDTEAAYTRLLGS
jgi:hypothetical protein